MSASNRHDHFISELETALDLIPNVTVLTSFNDQKWMDYKFPYVYVDFAPAQIEYKYENSSLWHCNQEFVIWCGISCATGADIRKQFSSLTFEIEKIFRDFEMADLTTDWNIITINNTILTELSPVFNNENTKYLYAMTGIVDFDLIWTDYHRP